MTFADKTVLFYDSGLFLSWAEVLTREFGRVLLYVPYKSQFVTSAQMRLGYGLPNVEHISPFGETKGRDFWDVVEEEEIDLFIFLDIGESDIQAQLKRMGKRVWGSGHGDDLELYRPEAKETIEKLGLPTKHWEVITGADNLREHLKDTDHPVWIKISGHRGDIESFRYNPEWPEDVEQDLRRLEDKLGRGVLNSMEFCVEDEIKPACEIGYDGPAIDGEFPPECVVGIEQKDESYFGVVTPYENLPDQLIRVNEALSPLLLKYQYRNLLSIEVRVPDDLEPYVVDVTARAPSPPSEGYQEIVDNWGEIFWYGAEGILVPWHFKFKYLCLGIIHCEEASTSAQAVRFPDSIASFVKLKNYCVFDGVSWYLPQMVPMKEIGSIVGMSDDPIDAIAQVHDRAHETNQSVKIDTISKAISSFEEGISLGVEFKGLELPKIEEIAKAVSF